jgi:tetratricopeptide (TPR) repeat protein
VSEQRLKVYQDLIQRLLSSSTSEEFSTLISQHWELIDSGFAEALRQESATLEKHGEQGNAKFLREYAVHLNARFFLIEILQIIADTGAKKQLVYPLLQSNPEKLNKYFNYELVQWVNQSLSTVNDLEEVREIALLIRILGDLLAQFPMGSRVNDLHLEIAISCFETVLSICEFYQISEQWIHCQFGLARVYLDRISGDRAENLELSIRYHKTYLKYVTKNLEPYNWAMAHNNLANVYLRRINGKRNKNLKSAVTNYKASLLVFTQEDFPNEWAMVQVNLGRTYWHDKQNKLENLESSISHYKNALLVFTRRAFPREWAITQLNLGNSYIVPLKDKGIYDIDQAMIHYKRSLKVLNKDTSPLEWSAAQNNLGNVQISKFFAGKSGSLKLAIDSFNKALQVRTRDNFPQLYAETQANIGLAYLVFGHPKEAFNSFKFAIDTAG